jgi:D-serine deaminase-like pyridoxal phosphate-dependent protein
MAKKQLDAGAIGICCQTIVEAEGMVRNGIEHVLLTNELASGNHIERFLDLRENSDIMVVVDGPENAGLMAKASNRRGIKADVLVEVNVGANKMGAEPGEQAARLCSWVSNADGLTFKGIMGYEGHLQLSIPDFKERRAKVFAAFDGITRTLKELEERKITSDIVTCGGTGTYNISSTFPGVTEIQPGSYLLMDQKYKEIETVGTDFQQSMFLLSTVISTPDPRRAVIDLGWKGCGMEYGALGWKGTPQPLLKDVSYIMGGDEHGKLIFEDAADRPSVGDQVRLVPSHCDTTMNLYPDYYCIRKNKVVMRIPVIRR